MAKIVAPLDSENKLIEELAFSEETILRFTKGRQIIKVIVVPNRLINIVVK